MRLAALAISWFLLSAFSTLDEVRALVADDRIDEGLRLSEERAAANDPEGHEALAWFYDMGRGVTEDDSRAAFHFLKAAEAGSAHAQWRLGVMLDLGQGVAENPDEAFSWISKSAAQDYAEAFVSLGVLYARGRGTPRDFARSRYWYLKAARAGAAHGFYGIGVLHEQGEGVEADPVEALAWFLVAAVQGDGEARQAVGRFRLPPERTRAAVERAHAILREFGLEGREIRVRKGDSEGEGPDTT